MTYNYYLRAAKLKKLTYQVLLQFKQILHQLFRLLKAVEAATFSFVQIIQSSISSQQQLQCPLGTETIELSDQLYLEEDAEAELVV